MRPEQWIKNLFVFIPLFFSRNIANLDLLYKSIITFLIFCCASSSIYCINDVIDVENDRIHPQKKNRPLAAGILSKSAAILESFVLISLTLALALVSFHAKQSICLSVVIGTYFILNLGYCLNFKNRSVIEFLCISFGFVLRVIAGGVSTGVEVSHWLILMTFLLALFLAIAKRRDDVIKYERTGVAVRPVVKSYNAQFMNQALGIVAAVTIVAYVMYTVSDDVVERVGSSYLYVTSVFVIAGILRYLQITLVGESSGSPTKVMLRDNFMRICVLFWAVSFFVILYVL